MVSVHVEVHAEEAAVCHVLQSSYAAGCLSHGAVLVSERLALFWVQQILLTLAFSAATPTYTCSLCQCHNLALEMVTRNSRSCGA